MPTHGEAVVHKAAAAGKVLSPYGEIIPVTPEMLQSALRQPSAYAAARSITEFYCTLADHCLAQANHKNLAVAGIFAAGKDVEGLHAIALPITKPADIAEAAVNALLSEFEGSCWKFQSFMAFEPDKVPDHPVGDEEGGFPSDLSRFTTGLLRDFSSAAIQEAEAYTQIIATL